MAKITWTNDKRKLSELIPWPRNPRQITRDQAARLRDSFDSFGQVETIAIGPDNDIYNGHQRLNVLMEQYGGDHEVEVRVASRALTEKEREKLTVYLHKGAAGEWDWDTLANEFEVDELVEWGFSEKDLQIGGFDLDEPKGDDPGAQVDKAEELRAKWGVETGQLWQLGEHRLICGDCTDRAVVERVMGGERADLMWTDPPYNVNYEGNYIQSGKILEEKEKVWTGGIENDSLEDFSGWLSLVYLTIDNFLSEGCAIYIWHPSGAEGRHFWSAWLWDDWHFQVDLVWNKTSLIISRWDYKPQHEPLMYGWKGKNRTWSGPNNEPTVWDFPRQQGRSGEERYHPTQKFPELAERPINNHGATIVVDPFLGSGTTLIACERLGRKCRAVEISPAYCAVAIQRWVDMTGGTPELITD